MEFKKQSNAVCDDSTILSTVAYNIRVMEKFCNIPEFVSFVSLYQLTEAIQAKGRYMLWLVISL